MTIPLFISKDHKVSYADESERTPYLRVLVIQMLTSCPLCPVQFSSRESILVCTGNGESKTIQELLPEILKQIGPDQLGSLQELLGGMKGPAKGVEEEDEDDDVPPLVEGTFDKPKEEEAPKKEAAKEEPKKEEPKKEEPKKEEPKAEEKPQQKGKGKNKKKK